MSALTDQLERCANAPATQRADGFIALLDQIISSGNDLVPNLTTFVQSITADSIGVISSRPLLSVFVRRFRDLKDNEAKIEAGTRVVDILAPKVVSYEQQDTDLKYALADAYEKDEDFRGSAKVLQTILLESSQRSVSDDEKAKVWMRICRCYLEEDDPTNALTYLNKIKQIYHTVTDQETRMHFQLSQARISDSQRNFLDASAAYLAISNVTAIDEEERLQALSAAIRCAVLAPAGPLRGRQLGKLYKDERSVDTPEYSILEKIFLDRILKPEEVSKFASGLAEHQLAKTSDGSTVLDKAILEHDVLAVSRIYANISFSALGELLGVDADRAEMYASGMIESNRLSGSIDQIAGIIHFNTKEGGQGNVMLDLRAWDANVQSLAEEVEKISTMLQREEPDWYSRHLQDIAA